jgi:hypothetical protein
MGRTACAEPQFPYKSALYPLPNYSLASEPYVTEYKRFGIQFLRLALKESKRPKCVPLCLLWQFEVFNTVTVKNSLFYRKMSSRLIEIYQHSDNKVILKCRRFVPYWKSTKPEDFILQLFTSFMEFFIFMKKINLMSTQLHISSKFHT